jgi:GT2 family glycosyltransferase
MLHSKGTSVPFYPFYSLCTLRLRDEASLDRAIGAFKTGDYTDALLAAEYVCRRFPSNSTPAILRAKILQACRPELAAKAWYRAWLCNPQDPLLQDAMLNAWLRSGAVASVANLGPVFLPERYRAGTHASLLELLQQANALPAGVCWKSGNRIEGMLFGSNTERRSEAVSFASSRLIVADETYQYEYELAADGRRFSLDSPRASGTWSIAWVNDATGASSPTPQMAQLSQLPQLLQGSPLAWGSSPDFIPRESPANPRSSPPVAKPAEAQGALDLIIPVYRNRALVQACIESVLASLPHNSRPSEVIVVDDASPEPELLAWLSSLAAAGRITLLRNKFNLGFIETINRGLRHHIDRDVVLLNADTLVHGDWLDRLGQALYSAPDIASVTPWSNNGEITSFPEIATPSPAPTLSQLAQIDGIAATLRRSGRIADVELPACCGFAMMMKRSVLTQIGLLDGQVLERGYGEEIDWCMRARAAGYRHLAATGVFVAHTGTASFRFEKPFRVRQNRALVMARYPNYYPEYHRFLADDPLSAARQTLLNAGEQAGLDWLAQAVQLLDSKVGFPHSVPAALPSSCRRIGVWQHKVSSPGAAKILDLARHIASRPALDLRLLVVGEASEALWHTGVIDLLPPARSHETMFLSDAALLGLSGCAVLLSESAPNTPASCSDIVQVGVDDAFQPLDWLSDWLSQRPRGLALDGNSRSANQTRRNSNSAASSEMVAV